MNQKLEIETVDDLYQFAEKITISLIDTEYWDYDDCCYLEKYDIAPIWLDKTETGYKIRDGNHRVSLAYHHGEEQIWAFKQDLSLDILESISEFFYEYC